MSPLFKTAICRMLASPSHVVIDRVPRQECWRRHGGPFRMSRRKRSTLARAPALPKILAQVLRY
jgi:hypothetical protein